MNRFDAIIIGTGQAGPSLADRLAKAGAAIKLGAAGPRMSFAVPAEQA